MIYHQNVFERWPIEDESVQSIITSPPYYALRKYAIPDIIIGDKDCKHEFVSKQDHNSTSNKGVVGNKEAREFSSSSSSCIHCNAWKGQYGLEPTPQMYVEHTRLWAKEAWRVLRKDGIFFLNLADSYPSGGGKAVEQSARRQSAIDTGAYPDYSPLAKLRQSIPKCQLLIPHRVAIGLVDDGWVLRNTIVWHKSNAMPESVTDRFSKKYEYIFMFTKQEKYYFDLNAVREPHKQVSIDRLSRAVSNNNKWVNGADGQTKHGLSQPRPNYKDRIGSMQTTEFKGGDYLCGKLNPLGKNPGDVFEIPTSQSSEKHYAMWPERLVERMVRCSTKAGDTVLDPFCGSGSTLKVAEELHRKGIGIDLGYESIQRKRLSHIQKRLII